MFYQFANPFSNDTLPWRVFFVHFMLHSLHLVLSKDFLLFVYKHFVLYFLGDRGEDDEKEAMYLSQHYS